MLALKKNQGGLTARKCQPLALTMLERQTPPLTGSLVRDGQTLGPIITVLLMWEITTSAGIPLEHDSNPRSGAIQQILNMNVGTAQFHSVLP